MVVDGDEDFHEEYGLTEEGKEWRHLARGGCGRRVHEWTALSLVRPTPPVAPRALLEAASPGTPVQVRQDGLWWQWTNYVIPLPAAPKSCRFAHVPHPLERH